MPNPETFVRLGSNQAHHLGGVNKQLYLMGLLEVLG